MTAVVRPIGIYHSYLCDSGISLLGSEVITAEADIIEVHSKTVLSNKVGKTCLVKRDKSVKSSNAIGHGIRHSECFVLLKGSLSRLNGVDDVLLYSRKSLVAHVAVKLVDPCSLNRRTLALRDYLYTLSSRIRSLVKLTGEIFNREVTASVILIRISNNVELRLRENGRYSVIKKLFVDILDIVSVEYANAGHAIYLQQILYLSHERRRFVCKLALLFYVNSVNHQVSPIS